MDIRKFFSGNKTSSVPSNQQTKPSVSNHNSVSDSNIQFDQSKKSKVSELLVIIA